MTDQPQDPAANEASDEQSAGASANGATGSRLRRPASLLKDAHIPDRAAALRDTLSERLHGSSDRAPDAGAVIGDAPADAADAAQSGIAQARERFGTLAAERPEVVVGAAFAGGLLLAMILKRLAR